MLAIKCFPIRYKKKGAIYPMNGSYNQFPIRMKGAQ